VTSLLRARLALVAAATLFSTGGAIIKAIDLDGWQIASFRSGIAALALLSLLPETRRLGNPRIWLVGLAFAVTMILFVTANKLTTALNTIYLQSTAPLYILLLGPVLLRERVTARDLAFPVALAAGMGLFFVGQESSATALQPRLGNALAAAAGVSWAFTVIGLRWLATGRHSTAAASAAGSLLACLLALPGALPLPAIAAGDLALLGFLGLFQIALAYLLMGRGVAVVPAFEASLILLIEPVLNPLWAYALHGEQPSPWATAGAVVILLATAARACRADLLARQ
jgi:drug/metabolite transporter (DMT)-like permease